MKQVTLFTFIAALSGAAPLSALVPDTASVAEGANALKPDKPVVIDSSVAFADSGNKWIAIKADVHAITKVPADKLHAVLRDLENQPKVFNKGLSSTKSVVIESPPAVVQSGEGGDGTATVVTTATFTTTAAGQDTSYTARITEKADADGKPSAAPVFIKVEQTAPNAQIRNLYAAWYISRVTVNGADYSYIRFYDSSEAAGGSAKKGIVSLGLNGAHIATLNQLIDAAAKR
jgi:hypothetical protein